MIEIKQIDNIIFANFPNPEQRMEAEQMLSDQAMGVLHLCDEMRKKNVISKDRKRIVGTFYEIQGFVEKKTFRCPKDLWEYLSGYAP